MKQQTALQALQEAFASQLQLSVIITDRKGKNVTLLSRKQPEAVPFFTKITPAFSGKVEEYDAIFSELERPVLIDSQLFSAEIGLKGLMMPIKRQQQTRYYIWSGVFIEQGYRTLLERQPDGSGESVLPLMHIPELSFQDIEEKIKIMSKMAEICQLLFLSEETEDTSLQIMKQFAHLSEYRPGKKLQLSEYLDFLLANEPAIEFAVFLKQNKDGMYQCREGAGELKEVLQAFSFALEELSGQTAIEGYNEWASEDQPALAQLFLSKGMYPSRFFIIPIAAGKEEAPLLLLGGSYSALHFSEQARVLIELIAANAGRQLESSRLKETVNRHLMRMSMLLEMSKAMQLVTKETEILDMIVDIATHLIPSDFCFAALTEGAKAFRSSQADLSLDNIEPHYSNAVKMMASSTKVPRLVEADHGMIMQYPLSYGKELLGILSVHLKNPLYIKEAEVYIANLANIGAYAVKQLKSREKERLGWDPSFQGDGPAFLDRLTGREAEVLKLLVRGYTNKEIADELIISVHTVKNHISNIFHKIGVSDRSQLIAMVYQLNANK